MKYTGEFTEALYQYLESAFREVLVEESILVNTPMRLHTSFKIGGPARLMVLPKSKKEVKMIVDLLNELACPYYVMGNGSNILVNSKGIQRPIIKISEAMQGVKIEGETVIAQGGILLSTLSNAVVAQSLTSFEWASGIPGTLGGAVCMNAGAYGGEMKDVVESVTVLDASGVIREISAEDMDFGYRHSHVMTYGWVVLEATLKLKTGQMETIKATLADLTERRTTKQPLHLPSAGSTFKRPVGHYAGQLIEESGLKGLRFGGAQVSEKHSGFIVNIENATYEDVTQLIQTVQKIVQDQHGVLLEPEVRILEEGF